MADETHTPGPWTTEERLHMHVIKCVPTRKGEHPEVAFLEAQSFTDTGSIMGRMRSRQELAANARLFSAAPELLAACESMQGLMAHLGFASGPPGSLYNQVTAAIAKAKGQ